jgi:hypothetical protein
MLGEENKIQQKMIELGIFFKMAHNIFVKLFPKTNLYLGFFFFNASYIESL